MTTESVALFLATVKNNGGSMADFKLRGTDKQISLPMLAMNIGHRLKNLNGAEVCSTAWADHAGFHIHFVGRMSRICGGPSDGLLITSVTPQQFHRVMSRVFDTPAHHWTPQLDTVLSQWKWFSKRLEIAQKQPNVQPVEPFTVSVMGGSAAHFDRV